MAYFISGTSNTGAAWCPEVPEQEKPQRQTRKKQNTRRQAPEVHEDLIEPCKVYVTNLRPGVPERELHEVMSHYAAVEKVIIIKDKHNNRSKGYGFVKVKTEEDVEKLLGLSEQDRYIRGRPVTIRRAKKRVILPGDEGYVRRPLPERDFELDNPDPTQPSIHMLVDDVIFKIFSYLTIKSLVNCERVCRRWQMLLHQYFTKVVKLELSETSLGIVPPITKPIVCKLLLLAGPNLKELKVQRADFATRQNILTILAQLCPELEYLDVSNTRGINFAHISKLVQGCKNIKGFVARNCVDFNGKAFQQLVVNYPHLEKLDLIGTSVNDTHFKRLPSSMKELYLENVSESFREGKRSNMSVIANKCPNLEVLEVPHLIMDANDLERLGKRCPNLTKLKIFIPTNINKGSMAYLKKLKELTLLGNTIDLDELCTSLPQLEALTLDMGNLEIGECDFSHLKHLRMIGIFCMLSTNTVLLSLTKCTNLEELQVNYGNQISEDVLLQIIQGCQKIRSVTCPSIEFTLEFIAKVEKALEQRTHKVKIEARDLANLIQTAEYDRRKMELKNSRHSLNFSGLDFDSDSEYSDFSIADEWIDMYANFPGDFDEDIAMVVEAWHNRSDIDDDDDNYADLYDLDLY